DSGPGIPETQRSKLFEEFQRLEEADNMGVRGAGLGLSIAQRMARLMGAEINVRSSLGQGSVFSVTVPRVERQRKRGKAITIHPQRNHADPTDLSGLRVLCVDDEPQILEAMTALLRKWGCSVVTAKSASETVEAFNQSAFDVLVADYQLSDTLTGLDLVTRYASALPDRTNATLLTAEATRTTESRAEALGIGILAKPADPVAIRQFLEDCLSRLKPQAAE
ncbi:MAG: response regulator, partial [Pseudomonadota bacterium]